MVPIFRAIGKHNMAPIANLFGKGIQNWVTHVNNCFMHGDHLLLMKYKRL